MATRHQISDPARFAIFKQALNNIARFKTIARQRSQLNSPHPSSSPCLNDSASHRQLHRLSLNVIETAIDLSLKTISSIAQQHSTHPVVAQAAVSSQKTKLKSAIRVEADALSQSLPILLNRSLLLFNQLVAHQGDRYRCQAIWRRTTSNGTVALVVIVNLLPPAYTKAEEMPPSYDSISANVNVMDIL